MITCEYDMVVISKLYGYFHEQVCVFCDFFLNILLLIKGHFI